MRKYPSIALITGSFICLGLGGLDILTGNEFNLSILFLAPILWVAWLLGNPSGYCLAVLCIFIWGISDKLAGHQFSSEISYGWNTTMRLGVFIIGAYFAEALAIALKREQELARRDYLTGAYNSKAFYEFLEIEAYRCHRYNRPLTVAYLDCDDFKNVNDRFGHHRGDELLRSVCDVLRRGLRLTDVCSRLGGDEFVIILPETQSHDAKNVFLRLRKILAETAMVKDLSVSFSVGIVTYLKPPSDLDDVVRKADELMYEAKRNGQDKVNAQVIGTSS